MNTLDEFAKFHKTDKSSDYNNYCIKFEKYLPFKRSDYLKILEIGVAGGGSLLMWRDYYYNSEIIGIDINSWCKQFEQTKVKIELGSQTDEEFLNFIISTYGPFDMIIDDGSHVNSDVIFSYKILFNAIKPGGIYVVEDSCTSYWPIYGGKYKKEGSTIEFFKNLIDDVNFRGLQDINYKPNAVRREDVLLREYNNQNLTYENRIESINFLNSLILITKR